MAHEADGNLGLHAPRNGFAQRPQPWGSGAAAPVFVGDGMEAQRLSDLAELSEPVEGETVRLSLATKPEPELLVPNTCRF